MAATRIRFGLCATVWAALAVPISAAELTPAEIVNEVHAGWDRYLSRFTRCTVRAITESRNYETNQLDGELLSKDEVEVKLLAGKRLYRRQRLDGKYGTRAEVTCDNDSYAFEAARETPSSPWLMTGFASDEQASNQFPELQRFEQRRCYALASQGLLSNGAVFADLIREPNFRLGKVTTDAGREGVVRVEFTYQPRTGGAVDKSVFRSGWFEVDPRKYWLMTAYHFEGQWVDGKAVADATFDFSALPDGTPVVSRRVVRTSRNGKLLGEVTTVHAVSEDEPSEADFRLTAFGLPEPVGSTETGSDLYLWLIGGAVVLGMAAAGFYYLQRRSAATQSAVA